ncbi:MAG: winged helix-turn-helix domain-containing protein [Acidobacteriaceae bacterium]|nr:winged helix-turn-helix domain-containing protein [Acidobacteriaceae bacterium]MBV9779568.1 winged helix-turn-helix domain-containing protein [Acidobacteriaceae bacterium]
MQAVYQFGPFRLDPAEHRLMRDGQPVSLAPKAFELLVYLVENHGRLLTKDQIMRAVWPGSFVEEANLTVSISALRKALEKADGDLSYIETIPKKGYRFAVSVEEVRTPELSPVPEEHAPQLPSPVTPRPSRRKTIVIAAAAVILCGLAITAYLVRQRKTNSAATSGQHSLAILPLQNVKHDPENDFLGFSLADAVITKLDSVSSLTVRPSSAIEKYRTQPVDIPRVASELNVDTLLTGTFIREGDDLRITYQLVDAKTDRILGKDEIDLKYDKLLTVQDNVTQQIIKSLELNLSPSEAERIKPDEPVNPLAYEYYLRGVDLMGSHNFPLAIKMLEKSADIDPKHALTWAYLGQCYTSDAAFEFGGRAQYHKAQAAYERALALRPKQIEASTFLANLLIDTGKVEQAVPLLRDALKSNPMQAAVHWELGYAYRFAGMLRESVAECERARQIDPSVNSGQSVEGTKGSSRMKPNGAVLNTYLYLGEYDKFLQSLPDDENSDFILFYRGFGEYHLKHWDRAAKDFDRANEIHPSLYAQIGKALSYSIARQNSEALGILHKVEDMIRQRGVGDPEATYKIAQSYAVLGDKISALRTLRSSIENGFFPYPYLVTDPLLANIHNEPPFAESLNLARRRYEAFKTKFF